MNPSPHPHTPLGRRIGFWHHAPAKGKDFAKDAGQAAWTDNRYKLHKAGPEKYALYDLVADPAEKKDLAAEKPEATAKMKAALGAWQESVLKSFRGEDYRRK